MAHGRTRSQAPDVLICVSHRRPVPTTVANARHRSPARGTVASVRYVSGRKPRGGIGGAFAPRVCLQVVAGIARSARDALLATADWRQRAAEYRRSAEIDDGSQRAGSNFLGRSPKGEATPAAAGPTLASNF